MRLENKIAIVTGAGSGFREGIARRFAAEGAHVVVNDIHAANGERVARDIAAAGGHAKFCAGDVSQEADVSRLVAFALAGYGDLDVVVNHADTPEIRAKFVASVPLGRLSQPSDIATAAVFSASGEGGFITGARLEVDGGRCV